MNVSKYKTKKPVVIKGVLVYENEVLYIQHYDPVNGRPQQVFFDMKLIGEISSDFYWSLKKETIEECVKCPTTNTDATC